MILYLKKISIVLTLFHLLSWFPLSNSYANETPFIKISPKKHVRILSIDGGGIRGLIPLLILQNLESRLKKGRHLTDCFDIMAGTSTGGIIVLLLNTPDESGKPKYKASQIVELYKSLGEKVFSTTMWQKIKTGNGWWGAKYSEAALERLLAEYFGKSELKDTLSNVIIPAYEIELDKTFFFKRERAKHQPEQNYFLKDLARATSAAPAYFQPAQIQNINKQNTYALIDGGLSVNNPTLSAAVYAAELYGQAKPFFILSLGTGTNYGAKSKLIAREKVEDSGFLGWAKKIIPTMMYAVNAVTDYEMRYVFNYNNPHTDYIRLQPIIESEHGELDNITPQNIKALEEYAEQIISQNEEVLQNIADVLNQEKTQLTLK